MLSKTTHLIGELERTEYTLLELVDGRLQGAEAWSADGAITALGRAQERCDQLAELGIHPRAAALITGGTDDRERGEQLIVAYRELLERRRLAREQFAKEQEIAREQWRAEHGDGFEAEAEAAS
jgi:hypothetical protein